DGHYGTFMLTKRMNRLWQMRGIYTFGKSTDEMSSNDNGTAQGEAIFNPLDISFQHALSDFDVSKRFTMDSLLQLPSPFKEGIGQAILGGWKVSTILVLQSGLPFTVYNGFAASGDYNADGYGYDVPNRPAAGAVHTGSRTDFMNGFASPDAFPIPTPGTEGN